MLCLSSYQPSTQRCILTRTAHLAVQNGLSSNPVQVKLYSNADVAPYCVAYHIYYECRTQLYSVYPVTRPTVTRATLLVV